MDKFYFSDLQENKAHISTHWDLVKQTWNPIILASSVLQENWQKLYEYFPQYQLTLHLQDQLIGYAVTLPFYWSKSIDDLPEEGWDWLLKEGIANFENNRTPNYLGGLLIGVAPNFRGKGLSKLIISAVKEKCIAQQLTSVVIPIRPTQKDQHPLVPMEAYMRWEKNGKIFDPWIRTHVNAGARIVKVCERSMLIDGSIADWEKWTDEKITQSSKKIISRLLSPVDFSIEKDIGIYVEPNIWIAYDI